MPRPVLMSDVKEICIGWEFPEPVVSVALAAPECFGRYGLYRTSSKHHGLRMHCPN